jgi:hypothetical protein
MSVAHSITWAHVNDVRGVYIPLLLLYIGGPPCVAAGILKLVSGVCAIGDSMDGAMPVVLGNWLVEWYAGNGVCCMPSDICESCCDMYDVESVLCTLSLAISASRTCSLLRSSHPRLIFIFSTFCISSTNSSQVLYMHLR